MALGEDLRADQDVGALGALEEVLEAAPASRGVAVQTQDLCLRKPLQERLLDSLRSASEALKVGIAALRADARDPLGEAAMVAAQASVGEVQHHVSRTARA